MRSFMVSLMAAGFLLSAACTTNRGASDHENIQGTWRAVSIEDSGRKAPNEIIKDFQLVITQGKITYEFGGKTTEWSTKLDATKTPKWVDLTEGSRTSLAIYELDGDNLKICFPEGRDGQRSTAFESKPNSVNDVLIILKRVSTSTEPR